MVEFKSVQQLFKNKKRWIKGADALNKYNEDVTVESNNACKWCLSGGLRKVYVTDKKVNDARDKIYKVINKNRKNKIVITLWNDTKGRTIEQVRRAIKRAGV